MGRDATLNSHRLAKTTVVQTAFVIIRIGVLEPSKEETQSFTLVWVSLLYSYILSMLV